MLFMTEDFVLVPYPFCVKLPALVSQCLLDKLLFQPELLQSENMTKEFVSNNGPDIYFISV